jgi:hypothetical protein
MEHVLSLEQLTDRLLRLENEIEVIRRALVEHYQPKATTLSTPSPMPIFRWADKQILQREMNAFCTFLSATVEPIGLEELQQRMSESGLAPNELSQSIIEARER